MKKLLINQVFPHFDELLKTELDSFGTLRVYKRDEIIVRQGEPLPATCIILTGWVKVYRENDQSKKFLLSLLRPGHGFAVSVSEDSSPAQQRSLMSFVAKEPCYVLTIPFAEKDLLAKKFDQWYKYLLQTAVMYYGFYIEVIDIIAFKKLDQKVIHYLKRIAQITQSNTIAVSHQEIADALNASREAVSRLLKKLEESNKIKLSHSSIALMDTL